MWFRIGHRLTRQVNKDGHCHNVSWHYGQCQDRPHKTWQVALWHHDSMTTPGLDMTLWTMSGQATHDMTSNIMISWHYANTRTWHDMANSIMMSRIHDAWCQGLTRSRSDNTMTWQYHDLTIPWHDNTMPWQYDLTRFPVISHTMRCGLTMDSRVEPRLWLCQDSTCSDHWAMTRLKKCNNSLASCCESSCQWEIAALITMLNITGSVGQELGQSGVLWDQPALGKLG